MLKQDFKKKLTEYEKTLENYSGNEDELVMSSGGIITALMNEDESENFKQYVDLTIRLADKIAEENSDKISYHYFKAMANYLGRKYPAYFENIECYLEKYLKSHESIVYKLADCIIDIWYIFSKHKDDDLLKNFRKILRKLCPNSAFDLHMKYILKDQEKPNIDKIKCLNKIVSADEHWMLAYWELGYIYSDEKQWQLAVANYERTLEECSFSKITIYNPSIYFALAGAFSKLKEYSKEAEVYEKYLEINPDSKAVFYNLGLCNSNLGKYNEALKCFDKSIKFETDKFLPFRKKFDTLLKMGRDEAAFKFANANSECFMTKAYQIKIKNISAQIDNEENFEKRLNKTTESDFAGTIEVAKSNSGIDLYQHQKDAIRQMNKVIQNAENYAGLLVLPTGGGKTLTATYWLMQNVLDQGRKILWLAHRHELLNQAQRSFEKVCYSDITKNKPQYNWRIISGQHDKAYNIKPHDDIIVASKTSLKRGFDYLNDNWLKENSESVFLVIDEAHHATANEYRELIELIKNRTKKFQMIGLTATPFRTLEDEQGQLKKVFPDDIVYKIDLRELVNRGILSEPIFKAVPTEINMIDLFLENDSEKALNRITKDSFFDIDSIGENIAKAIATNSRRNDAIVNEYVNNKSIYRQTLVFALNIDMAIALNALFKERGIRSDFVVSSIKDSATLVTISSKENQEKIAKFRNGGLEVLVNVNILTEGTDLPNAQSVFLTRPTKSTILMTQMIGRALRGEKAGGTKEAYIVSFIDDWQDKIAWVNPEQLYIDENVDFSKRDREAQQKAMRLVSIAKIEEFAKIANDTLDSRLRDLPFEERIPMGIFKFSYLIDNVVEDEIEKHCNILVYDCMKRAYDEFFDWLPHADLSLERSVAEHVENSLFDTRDMLLGYNKQDILDIINFFKQTEEVPQFIQLSDRKDYNIEAIAKQIIDSPENKVDIITKEWERSDKHWSAFFGIENQKVFRKLISDAIDRIQYPDDYKKSEIKPMTRKEIIKLKDLTLYEIREKFPELGEKLRSSVFEKYTDLEGFYYCAESGYRSKNRLEFQIDHIIPMSKGGVTEPENLQLLTRTENMKKGAKI